MEGETAIFNRGTGPGQAKNRRDILKMMHALATVRKIHQMTTGISDIGGRITNDVFFFGARKGKSAVLKPL